MEENSSGDGVVETGSELGSVQTPASVWLPFETSTPGGKVVHVQMQTVQVGAEARLSACCMTCTKMPLIPPAHAIACRSWGR